MSTKNKKATCPVTPFPRILFLDIETAPNLATVWSIWQQNIGLNQLLETSYILCWAAKWRGSKTVMFDSVQKSGKDGVVKSIYKLLDEADIVIHFNGRRFDIPTLNREFLLRRLTPPSPYKQIDLHQSIKKKFRFVSHKLAHITKQLGMDGKIKTDHKLWLDCMNGDPEAWKKMEKYNKKDVTEMEPVYEVILPWIDGHPNMGIYCSNEKPTCTNCGSDKLWKKGFQRTKVGLNQRYQCQRCGTWLKSRYSEKIEYKKNILTQITD